MPPVFSETAFLKRFVIRPCNVDLFASLLAIHNVDVDGFAIAAPSIFVVAVLSDGTFVYKHVTSVIMAYETITPLHVL